MEQLINDGKYGNFNISSENVQKVREDFVANYCQLKGWDITSLTNEQMAEIEKNKQYKNPSMINS